MTRSVAVYARISDDREAEGLGVGRQEADARALAELRGWDVAYVAIDNSVSAYKRGVIRPQFELVMDDLAGGRIDGVVAYDLDRFARKPTDLERAIEIYDRRGGVFATVQGDIDLSTPDGRTMARVMVAFANKSSMDTSRRVARKHLELAQAGKVGGGGNRPFGYEPDRVTVRPDEAELIRQAGLRILAGESLTSICKSWDQAGVPPPGSNNRWDRGVLKRMMLRPRVAGLRVYRGAVLMDDSGHPVKGTWPAILDMATWETLKEVLTNPSRNPNAGRIDRHYLLSGFLRCNCGAKMYGLTKHGKPNYTCPSLRGCGKTHRRAEPIDEHITELVLRYLETQEVGTQADVVGDSAELDAAITQAERSLGALITEWNAGRMSDQVFFTAQAQKEATLTALKRSRTQERRSRIMIAPVGDGVRGAWDAANLSQRRAILSDVLLAVQVLPKPHTAPRQFDARYLQPVWRT
jgi:site-specific DNA recombinase